MGERESADQTIANAAFVELSQNIFNGVAFHKFPLGEHARIVFRQNDRGLKAIVPLDAIVCV